MLAAARRLCQSDSDEERTTQVSLVLPRSAWPAAGQMMWDALRKQADPFDNR